MARQKTASIVEPDWEAFGNEARRFRRNHIAWVAFNVAIIIGLVFETGGISKPLYWSLFVLVGIANLAEMIQREKLICPRCNHPFFHTGRGYGNFVFSRTCNGCQYM